MPPRKLRSPLALVVLGLLAEEPLHPYAMRQRISERAHDRLPGVRPASLYDVVQRLADAGLVSAGEPSREGNRPERVSYVITGAGRDALTGWVGRVAERSGTRRRVPGGPVVHVRPRPGPGDGEPAGTVTGARRIDRRRRSSPGRGRRRTAFRRSSCPSTATSSRSTARSATGSPRSPRQCEPAPSAGQPHREGT